MKPIKVKETKIFNGEYLLKDDIIEPTKENYNMIVKLNELGFIYPLTIEELIEIKREIDKKGGLL